jgi:RNA polymerase sigma factor (sigma-70 family)
VEAGISTIARRTLADFFRRKKTDAATRQPLDPDTPDNQESIIQRMGYEDILRLVAGLSSGLDRAVFRLALLDDLSHRRISEILDISENASKKRLERLRRELRRLLRDEHGVDDAGTDIS